MRQIVFAALLATTALTPGAGLAQTSTAPAQTGALAQQVSAPEFIKTAAISGLFEVQSSRLALERSQADQVRQFAQRMVDDHTRASDELKSLVAASNAAAPPSTLDQKHAQMMEQLRGATGDQFDRLYSRMQVQGHEEAVALFRSYGQAGDNAQLQQWAQKTLPTLEQHLQMARMLDQATVASRGAATQGQTAQSRSNQPAQSQGAQVSVVPQQRQGQTLADDLIGSRAYNLQSENIGEVEDLLMDENGKVVAVIIGVGGFLGIGERDVAIPFSQVEMRPEDEVTRPAETARDATGATGTASPARDDDMRVVVDATRDQLKNLPEFVKLEDRNRTTGQAPADRPATGTQQRQ